MYTLAVIGAGQLGTRHLQSLIQLKTASAMHVVDPFEASRTLALTRWEEAKGSTSPHTLQVHADVSGLPAELDFVVVACNADVRRGVVEALLKHSKVKYLLLEKVLFQRVEDYAAIEQLCEKHGTRTYVNCPRRVQPVYQALKAELQGQQVLSMHLSGSNWGLGCNSVHYLDLLAYLSPAERFHFATSALDSVLQDSKRKGFKEFTGQLSGRTSTGSVFTLTSHAVGAIPIHITIDTTESRFVIREGEGKYWKWSAGKWEEHSFQLLFQSQLTALVAEALLHNDSCDLTSLSESSRIHVGFLSALNAWLAEHNYTEFNDACPIT